MMALHSLSDNLNDNVSIRAMEDQNAYILRVHCRTVDMGLVMIKQMIEANVLLSWGPIYMPEYIKIMTEHMIDKILEDIYYTHGQGDYVVIGMSNVILWTLVYESYT